MRTADIYVFCLQNGSMTSFKKSYPWSGDPPPNGRVIPLANEGDPKGVVQPGVVINARETENSVEIILQTSTDIRVLRDCLDRAGWDEVPYPAW